ncbi:EAL domain-containing protein [Pseudoteredinibacter isoporae]|uniref:EAL domain-containing protein (Putative c-di-GMP-specific phosphodiesterase class I) n=1 Tax=Pseudoteredinibacter isoporae TaxID=570281 RepID=A0A7X0JUG6_9GAMM|nr:EAL domain-containing protein [Pseudoteredinibacter isoporae]MBB6522492.1 EAL domain-containing protein (putative c-di-GMP-specific phosphodiesterase class I) [Pseudoteredinibacter isoporae]NHO88021.1 EAL domain-containing protein [Pseudoteredinibacter isoporae]NIB23648.1 EAL domain-containing protein [Pseudoteredinibacter isoporae]
MNQDVSQGVGQKQDSDGASYVGIIEIADYEGLAALHGPASAQLLLDEFHRRLKEWVRPIDQSKILKDRRFLVSLSGVADDAQLQLATAKLERLFSPPCELMGIHSPIGYHAGFCLHEGDEHNSEQTLLHCRIALRQARKAALPMQVFQKELKTSLDDESRLVSALEQALERGEFRLYYQAKVHTGYRTVVGAEALLRWHSSDKKIIMPGQFIDVAERHGVIRSMTWWVLKSAIARLNKWPEAMGISVNVPPCLLLDDEIVTVLDDALAIYDVAPERLTLEITENLMISDYDQLMLRLNKLHTLGVRISIDDFGTGYSSLAQFRNLPADELKIDKGFVMAMEESDKDLAIVKAVIGLARNFGMRVVAEGVETEAAAAALGELGADQLQGFFFDKALPVEDFEKRYLS